jgi:PAS domain S-box-containing protein
VNDQLIKILLVEDNPGDVRLVRELLSLGSGNGVGLVFELTQVERLGQALSIVAEADYALILLDLSLPDSQGLETIQRTLEAAPNLPVVVMSGLGDEAVAIEAVKAGAQDYLVKGHVDEYSLPRAIRYAIERKRVEEALRESEEKFRKLTAKSPNMIFINRAGSIVYANEACEQIMGYTREELLSPEFDFLRLIAPESIEMVKQNYRQHMQGQEVPPYEYRLLTKDGGRLDAIHTTRLIKYYDRPAILGIVTDITKRKQTEAALRESEMRFRSVAQSAADAIISANSKGHILSWNKSAQSMFGYREEEVVGKPLTLLIPERYQAAHREGLERFSSTGEARMVGKAVELHGLRKDGREFPVEISLGTWQTEEGTFFSAVIRDITERKQAEEKIRQRNRELALLNRIIAASVTDPEPETVLEIACRELGRFFKVPRTSATLLNDEKTATVVTAEYRTKDQPTALGTKIPVAGNPTLQHLLGQKGPLVVSDAQYDPRLRSIRELLSQFGTVSLLVLPLRDSWEVVGSLSLETTESRQFSAEEISLAWSVADQVAGVVARARLADTRRLLSTAIEQSADSIIITDTAGTILYVNPAFEHASGYSRLEALGQNPRLLKSGKHDTAFFEELWTTISIGQVWQGRLVNQKKDGTLYTDETTISPVRDASGAITNYVGIQRDVTRELELEEQYRQAQKMEAVGRLTGGIAHDFNNLLTAINGFAELLQMRLPPDDPFQKLAGHILHSGQRAAGLIRQLMAFSRKQIVAPEVMSLNTVVDDMDKLLRRIIGEDIQMATLLTPELWPVKIDASQIEQVIVNLAVNARDAMPRGGRLTIETANKEIDAGYVADHLGTKPGAYVLLAISDTGSGMSEAVQAHIFEPFFTTKEEGQGTGLGLATVFGIVQQSEGRILCYSEPGQGTSFKIYLPRAEEPLPRSIRSADITELPTGSETILLVEDDAQVRELVERVLQEQGYTVLVAPDGPQALELSTHHVEPIHLLLTDVVLPGVSGKELAETLVQAQPGLKTLYMSGYTDEAISHHGVLEPGVAFLQKPVSLITLARKIREVLDAA